MNILRKFLGVLRFIHHYRFKNNRDELNFIAKDIFLRKVNPKSSISKGKVFVLTVGFSKSGKTTLIKNHPRLKSFFRISSSEIHDRINRAFAFLQDDNSVEGHAYWERQITTRYVRQKILELAFRKRLCTVNDSANLKEVERKKRLNLAKKYGYKTIIIHVKCKEEILLNRLREADQKSIKSGGQRVWEELYKKNQKHKLNEPKKKEADKILIFESGQDKPEDLNLKPL